MNRKKNPKANSLRANRGGTRKSSQQGGMKRPPISRPPAFQAVSIRKGHVRFIATAAISGDFLVSDLVNLPGILAGTTVLGFPIASMIKLDRVDCWAPVQNAGTSVEVSLSDQSFDISANNQFNGLPILKTDTSISFDRPAFVSMRFDQKRPSGCWKSSGAALNESQNLFALTCPLGTTVDIHFSYLINLGIQNVLAPNAGIVLVAATAGLLYNRKALTNLTPQGVLVI